MQLKRTPDTLVALRGPYAGRLQGLNRLSQALNVLDTLPQTGVGGSSVFFNVRDYGALGNGSADDSNAIQACVNAAIAAAGTVYFPMPSNYYRITKTIYFRPTLYDQRPVNIIGEGDWHMIEFRSTTHRACFEFRGMKRVYARGINIRTMNDDHVAWDVVMDSTYQSQSHFKYTLCNVSMEGKASSGWRLRTEGGAADTSVFVFDTCGAEAGDNRGGMGWLDVNANGLGYTWINCGGAHLYSFYNNIGREGSLSSGIDASQTTIAVNNPERFAQRGARIKIDNEFIDYTAVSGSSLTGCTRGVGGSTAASHGSGATCRIDTWEGGGGEGKNFFGCVTSYNEHDFFVNPGLYNVFGGRFEVGKKFARFGTWSTGHTMFNVVGATATMYGNASGADAGVVFHIGGPTKLSIDSCLFSQIEHTQNFIKDIGLVGIEHSGPGGSVAIRNSSITNTQGLRRFWTLQSHYEVKVTNLMVANTSGMGYAIVNYSTSGIEISPWTTQWTFGDITQLAAHTASGNLSISLNTANAQPLGAIIGRVTVNGTQSLTFTGTGIAYSLSGELQANGAVLAAGTYNITARYTGAEVEITVSKVAATGTLS